MVLKIVNNDCEMCKQEMVLVNHQRRFCDNCKKIRKREWDINNPEKLSEMRKKRYSTIEGKKKHKVRTEKYMQSEKGKKTRVKYLKENQVRFKNYRLKYSRDPVKKARKKELDRIYRLKNRDSIRQHQKVWREENRDKIKNYRDANREILLLKKKLFRADKTRRNLIQCQCSQCGEDFKHENYEENRKFCSRSCYNKYLKDNYYELKSLVPMSNTTIELKVQNFLKILGLEFYTHQHIKEIEHSYQCDIFVPVQEGIKQKIIIECDGDYWHGNEEIIPLKRINPNIRKQRGLDKLRTKELENQGYKVIRIWEHIIRSMELNDFIKVFHG